MRDSYDMFQQPERGRFGENELKQQPASRLENSRTYASASLAPMDFALIIKAEKPLSLAVVDPAKPSLNNGKWIWLPKSQVEFERGRGASVVVTMPEWLAVDKGFV